MLDVLHIGNKIEMLPVDKSIDGEERPSYSSQIMDIAEEEILCAMPISEGKLVLFEVGMNLEVYFYSGKSIYFSDCTVVSRGKQGNIYTITIKPNSEPKKFQRREFFRLECRIEVAIKLLGEAEIDYFEKNKKLPLDILAIEDRGIIIDISGGGLRILSRTRYEKNSMLNVRFPILIGEEAKVMDLVGKVVRTLESPNSSDVYDIRVQFKNISKENLEHIVKYIFEQQRLMRKKEMG